MSSGWIQCPISWRYHCRQKFVGHVILKILFQNVHNLNTTFSRVGLLDTTWRKWTRVHQDDSIDVVVEPSETMAMDQARPLISALLHRMRFIMISKRFKMSFSFYLPNLSMHDGIHSCAKCIIVSNASSSLAHFLTTITTLMWDPWCAWTLDPVHTFLIHPRIQWSGHDWCKVHGKKNDWKMIAEAEEVGSQQVGAKRHAHLHNSDYQKRSSETTLKDTAPTFGIMLGLIFHMHHSW